jgi:3-oxoacyl-[acyl-carrier protein] reductase
MKERQFGRIINIISTSVKQPIENLGVSNTVRGAVANWAKTLANELGPFGITVNNVLPGATETARLSEIFERKAIAQAKSAKEVAQHEAQQIPLRRFAKPEEIADSVVFLGSARASYITGTNLTVDGGRTGSL